MARMRSIKPEFWSDEDLADISRDARLLYIGLWNLSDEHGRLRGDPRYIKGQLFPYDDDLTAKDVDALIDALTGAHKVRRYQVASSTYLYLPNLHKHQRLDTDKVPSRLPEQPELFDPNSSAAWSGKFPDESAPDPDESALARARLLSMEHVAGSREHVGVSPTAPHRAPTPRGERGTRLPDNFEPTPDLVAWARDKAPTTTRADHEAFADYWRAIPGAKGRKLDWPATWRGWMRREHERRTAGSRASPNGTREHNGLKLSEKTIEDLERVQRLAAFDAQNAIDPFRTAIGGTQ